MGVCHCVKNLLFEDTQNKALILVGPSGIGKEAIMKKAIEKYPNSFQMAVYHTTKAQQEEEVAGKDFYFVTKDEYDQLKSEGKLIETRVLNEEYYAISKEEIEKAKTLDKIMYLYINLDTASKLVDLKIDANFIAITPTEKTLGEKIKAVKEKVEEQSLIDVAKEEIKKIAAAAFVKARIENDNEDTAFMEFETSLKELYPDKLEKIGEVVNVEQTNVEQTS